MERLTNTVHEYAWGDLRAIAHILGHEPNGQPQAELWMGAHPKSPSTLDSGITLDQAIADNPNHWLGAPVAEHFGRLPFLFKILAAGKPLSIQSHPSLEQAQAGFARENNEGIAMDAFHRTYRDDNHKPEMICALTPFVGKCGFRNLQGTQDLLSRLKEPHLDELRSRLAAEGHASEVLANTLAWLLHLSTDETTSLVAAAVNACANATHRSGFEQELDWTATINNEFPGDIGVVVALLLNHVVLEPGEAFFLAAGNLHAYLQGVGVELMANSDNVVRGGLTPKNIDIAELLSVVDCSPIDPPVQQPASAVHTFAAPVSEFSLTRVELDGEPVEVPSNGPEIVLVVQGSAQVSNATETLDLAQGQTVFVSASDGPYKITGTGLAFRAATPQP